METSAPKRRRTSPRTAIPIQPAEESESTTPQDAPPRLSASPTRPSFASPTRASLGRFNPEVLRRREAQTRRLRSSPPDAPGSAPRAVTPDSTGSLARALRTRLDLRSAARDGGAQRGPEEGSILRSPPRRLGPTHASTTRPTPRPLPPPGPDDDEEILNSIARRGLRRTILGVLPEVVVPEPELPPTPEHPDPVVSTPPSGIHNTPSRRPRRNKSLAENIKSSSPLKPPPSRPPGLPRKGAPPEFHLPVREDQAAAAPAPTTAELRGLKPPDPDAEEKKRLDSLLAEISQLERDIDIASRESERIHQAHLAKREASPPPNKHEILDFLRRTILPPEEPDHDVQSQSTDLLASALDPIAFLPFSKPKPAAPPVPAPQPPNTEKETPKLTDPISHRPIPMSASEALPYLQVFTPLTFTSHISLISVPSQTHTTTPNSSDTTTHILLQKHSITAMSSSSSSSLRGLFAARIEMTVDPSTLRITDLSVPRLDPSAAGELAPFVEQIVTPPPPPPGGRRDGEKAAAAAANKDDAPRRRRTGPLYHNVTVLAWAMGEWLRVAVQRARVWLVLERELRSAEGDGGGDKMTGLGAMVARLRARGERMGRQGWGGWGRRRRRRRRVDDEGEEGQEGKNGDDEDGAEGGEEEDGAKYEAADLLPYMGRTNMDYDIPVLDGGGGTDEGSTLRVQWRIKFDWTGEARSEIGVLVGLPGKWHQSDERGRLSGIPGLFDELIQGGEDPLNAVRTVACLLAGAQMA